MSCLLPEARLDATPDMVKAGVDVVSAAELQQG